MRTGVYALRPLILVQKQHYHKLLSWLKLVNLPKHLFRNWLTRYLCFSYPLLNFLLRRVKVDSQVKQSNGSNLPIQTKVSISFFPSYAPLELGSCSVTPLLTERSNSISKNRVDRL